MAAEQALTLLGAYSFLRDLCHHRVFPPSNFPHKVEEEQEVANRLDLFLGGTNLGLFHVCEGFKLAGGVLFQHGKQAIVENSQLFFDAIVVTRKAVEVRDDGVLIG